MSLRLRVNILVAEVCRFQRQENDIAHKIACSLPDGVTGCHPTQISPDNHFNM